MDQRLVDLCIDYHGPVLVDRLSEEQPNISLPNFLSLKQEGRNREMPRNAAFEGKIASFIAKKADLLFLPLENAVTSCVPDKKESDYYAVVPPLESFMGVPTSLCREHFYKDIQPGDTVVAAVSAVQESGLQLLILSLDCGKVREVDQLKILAFCPEREVPKYFAHEDPLDAFTLKDKVRGVVLSAKPEFEKIIVSLLPSSLPPEQDYVKIGLINDDEVPVHYQRLQDLDSCTTYEDCLLASHSFSNCCNVQYLTGLMGLSGHPSPSIMRGLHGAKVPKGDTAIELRKAQSGRWALKSVAEGVSHFKAGRFMEAMQHLNMALKIDIDNVEALVARGALYANNESYSKALEDFDKALSLNTSHSNARKYTCETLLAYSRSLIDTDQEAEAVKYLERILSLDPDHDIARHWLYRLRHRSPSRKVSVSDNDGDGKVPLGSEINGSPDQHESPMKKTTETLRRLIEEDKVSRKSKKRLRQQSDSSPEQSPTRVEKPSISDRRISRHSSPSQSSDGRHSPDYSPGRRRRKNKSSEEEYLYHRLQGKSFTTDDHSNQGLLYRNRSRSRSRSPDQKKYNSSARFYSKSPVTQRNMTKGEIESPIAKKSTLKSRSNSQSPEMREPFSGRKLYQERDSLSPDSLQYIKDRQRERETLSSSSQYPVNPSKYKEDRPALQSTSKSMHTLRRSRSRERREYIDRPRNERSGYGDIVKKDTYVWDSKTSEKAASFFGGGYWSRNDPQIEQQRSHSRSPGRAAEHHARRYEDWSRDGDTNSRRDIILPRQEERSSSAYIKDSGKRRHHSQENPRIHHEHTDHRRLSHDQVERDRQQSGDRHSDGKVSNSNVERDESKEEEPRIRDRSESPAPKMNRLVSYSRSPSESPAPEFIHRSGPYMPKSMLRKDDQVKGREHYQNKSRKYKEERGDEAENSFKGRERHRSRHDSGHREDVQDRTITSSSDHGPRSRHKSGEDTSLDRNRSHSWGSDNRESRQRHSSSRQEESAEYMGDSGRDHRKCIQGDRRSSKEYNKKHQLEEYKGGRKRKREASGSDSSSSSSESSDEKSRSKGKKNLEKSKDILSKSDGKTGLAKPRSVEKEKQNKRKSLPMMRAQKSNDPGKRLSLGSNRDSVGKTVKGEKDISKGPKESTSKSKPGESLEEMEQFLSMLKTKKKEQIEQEKQEQPKQSYKRW